MEEGTGDFGNRLSVRQKTRLDVIKDVVPKPPGYLPVKSLPTWEEMPLEQKIPVIPAPPGKICIFRGKLGNTLNRPTDWYTTWDLHNQTRIPSNKYEGMHDPSVKRFLHGSSIISILKSEGLVDGENRVICSIGDFNRYRLYLATLYNDKVREGLANLDSLKDLEREIDRAFIKEQQSEGIQAIKKERSERAKRAKIEYQEAKVEAFLRKEDLAKLKREALEEERLRQQAAKVFLGEDRKARQAERISEMERRDIEWRRTVLHKSTLKEMQSSAYKERSNNQKKIHYNQKIAQWFDAKLISAAERLQREKQVQTKTTHDMKRKAVRRQKFMEKFRAELPMRIEKMHAEKRRLEDVVRKYAMRWLNRVRARLNKPRDEKHESVWYSQTKHALQDSMKYLQEKSGYEKLDDVVMNILKFKEALKRQLLIEEEEEEAMEGEGEGEHQGAYEE